MTLQEAIERIKLAEPVGIDWSVNAFLSCVGKSTSESISIILNAVVNGELK